MSGRHKGYHGNPQRAAGTDPAGQVDSLFETGARYLAKSAQLLGAMVDELNDAEVTAKYNTASQNMAAAMTDYASILNELTGRLRHDGQ